MIFSEVYTFDGLLSENFKLARMFHGEEEEEMKIKTQLLVTFHWILFSI